MPEAAAPARALRKPAYRGPACPYCQAAPDRLDIHDGLASCRACARSFAGRRFSPPRPDPVAAASIAVAEGSALCARHARNRAVAACETCGAFMCDLCRVDCDGKALCAACFDRLGERGELREVVTRFRNYGGMAVHSAFIGLIPLFGTIFGPFAIAAAIIGIRRNRRTGESISSAAAWTAIILGAVDCAFAVMMILSMAHVVRW